jgi:hypothetical protein
VRSILTPRFSFQSGGGRRSGILRAGEHFHAGQHFHALFFLQADQENNPYRSRTLIGVANGAAVLATSRADRV